MQNRTVDVLVIGAGSAGLNAVSELERAGVDWLLVEADQYGTTCARVGCMPSKLLIAAAEAATAVRDADTFGIRTVEVEIDGAALLQRVRDERDRFVQGVVDDTNELPDDRRALGRARFVDDTTVVVGDDLQVTARAVVVAVGGTPSIPTVFDPIRERLLTSDTVFELDRLPQSVAVIGTGAIGLELGQALDHLGSAVTFISHGSQLGPLTDPQLQAYVQMTLAKDLDIHLNASIKATSLVDDGLELTWHDDSGTAQTKVFDDVLVAAGRKSHLSALNLKTTNLALDEHGWPDWDSRTSQCGDLPIFLAGDANNHKALLHEAADEGRIAAQNAITYPDIIAHVRRTPLSIVFTDPQMAIAGIPFANLDQSRVVIAEASFENQGRARVINKARGLVRFYADRDSCVLLGAELFGPQVEHLAHLLAWSIEQRLTVQRLLEMPFYHPVLEEGLRTGLRQLAKALKVAADCRCEDRAATAGM